MSGNRIRGLVAVGVAVLGASVWSAPAALAEPSWNGRYEITFFTAQKSGTSMAANQPESMHVDVYTFSSSCSSGSCVATITDGPAPRNPTVPQQVQFTWDGSAWTSSTNWRWACLLPDGTIEWNPASSTTRYTPKPDGTLMGEWHTDIASGACQGSVDMPMEAVPI